MRSGGLGGGFGAADLDQDDRLGERHFAGGGKERARVADRLHVHHDRAGVGIVAELVDKIAPADIKHRAERHESAEADILAQAPIQHGGAERAALAEEGHPAGLGHAGRKRGVQLRARRHDTEAIRADDPDASLPGGREDLLLQRGAFRADFLEAGRDDHDAFDTGLGTFAHERRHRGRRRHDDHEVRHLRQRLDTWIGLEPEHGGALGVDRKDRAGETGGREILEDRAADAAGILGGADERDRARGKERLQGMPPSASHQIVNVLGLTRGSCAWIVFGFRCHEMPFKYAASFSRRRQPDHAILAQDLPTNGQWRTADLNTVSKTIGDRLATKLGRAVETVTKALRIGATGVCFRKPSPIAPRDYRGGRPPPA